MSTDSLAAQLVARRAYLAFKDPFVTFLFALHEI